MGSSMKQFRLWSSTRVLILRPSLCMSAYLELLFYCFFLHSIFSQERKVVLDPNLWRLEPMTTVLTTSGSPSQPSGPQVLAKPAPGREKQSVALVLTPSKNSSGDYDLVNQDSDLQQATTHFDFLKVNGHQIWISDFAFTLDFIAPMCVFRHFKDFKIRFYCDSSTKLSKILEIFQLI